MMFSKFKALKNCLSANKDGKALASNFGYLMIMQIAGYIFPLLTIPYLARVIGVEGFGKIAFAAAVMIWFQTITDWGFSYTATRDVARHRDNLEKVSEIFSNVLWAKTLLASISFVLLYILTEVIPYLKENQILLFITFMLVPAKILFADWFFQAIEKMKFITIFDLISKLVFTLCIFMFIKEKSDFILQPLFLSLGSILVSVVSFYLIVFKFKVKVLKPNVNKVSQTIKNSKDVFINNTLPNLYNSFSVVLLGMWGGSTATGIYDAGKKFIGICHSFMSIFIRVFFPYLSRMIDKHNLFAKIHLSIAALASLVLFIIAPYLIKFFFTEEFYEAILILKISSISIFLIALSQVYGTNYLIIQGYTKTLRNITFMYSIVGFTISFPLVYMYSYIGAAITLVSIQFLIGFTVMFKALSIQKEVKLKEVGFK